MTDEKAERFLRWEEKSRDVIDVKRCYIRLAGDLVTGVLLSQIIYWFLPTKRTGDSRISIDKDGRYWLAKKREDWWDECCISPKQFDRSIDILEKLGVVSTALFKFNGSPTKHISLNFEAILKLLNRGENGYSPKGKIELPQTSNSKLPFGEEPLLTEITAETTAESFIPRSVIESQEEAIYEAYPRRVGKEAALKAIRKAIERLMDGKPPRTGLEAREFLYKKTLEYANSPCAVNPGKEEDFRPHPSTWFNQGHYFDDVSEWQRSNGTPQKVDAMSKMKFINGGAR